MTEVPRKGLAVIGIGNVLYGDDGLGPRAIWLLQSAARGTGCLSFPSPPGRGEGVRENAPDRQSAGAGATGASPAPASVCGTGGLPASDVGAHGVHPIGSSRSGFPLPPGEGQGEGERPGHPQPCPPLTGDGQGRASCQIPPGVDLIDGGSIGLDLLDYLKDYVRVIIIDAADMGLPPGTVRTFTPDEVESLKGDKSLSLHSTDVLGVIALGRTLGETLAAITIIAVQPEFVGPKDGLSDSVTRSLQGVLTAVASLART